MTKRKQYIYRIQPSRADMLSAGPTTEETQIINQHYEYLQQLQAQGKLILAGRTQNTDESGFGIAIFEAESDVDADLIMGNDPAVNLGIFNAWLFPFKVALKSMG